MQYDFVIPAGARVFEYLLNQTTIEPGYLKETTNRIQRIASFGCLENFKEPLSLFERTTKNSTALHGFFFFFLIENYGYI
jgi:hypothetical protein